MFTFLLVLLIIDSIILMAAILFQSGKGGGLAASFGGVSSSSDSLLGTRQAGNLLTKASWWCGGIFLFLSFVLSLASTRQRAPKSVLDQIAQPTAPAPPPPPPRAPLERWSRIKSPHQRARPPAAPARGTRAAPGVNPTPAPPAPTGTAPAAPAPKKP